MILILSPRMLYTLAGAKSPRILVQRLDHGKAQFIILRLISHQLIISALNALLV